MSELSVSPWKRHGQDRLYVNLPDGTAVAWVDCRTGKVTVEKEQYRRAALDALRPHLARKAVPLLSAKPPSSGGSQGGTAKLRSTAEQRPMLPALTSADDLELNRPGAALLALIAAKGPTPMQRVWARLLRRSSDWDPWFAGLAGERRVGRELKRLSSFGWRVLHGIPLPNAVDIDHLLIGPGGVFSINTKHHNGKPVWVGDDMVKVNHGPPQPYPASSRAEARRVQRVLERFCGFAVTVVPTLVFVGVTDLVKATSQLTVRAYREREVSALGPLTGELTPDQVEAVYAVARHRRAWLGA
ncbi:nuclease-related domain-containing protein [Streptomyces sp. NPDC002896]|uniref:nuclease-related domain-containing protein n=1 Tax=Streptomyces sp. NPDC002896 TaxID=3154438 RepID=UPI00332543EF